MVLRVASLACFSLYIPFRRFQFRNGVVLFAALTTVTLLLPLSRLSAESKAPESLGSIRDPEDQPVAEGNESTSIHNLNEISEVEFPGIPKTLGWELILSQKAYKVAPTIRTISDLLTALSKSIEHSCLGELQRSLTYYPPPTDPGCLKLLDVLSQVDKKNPLLVCTKLGFDAQECGEAYASQEVTDKIPEEFIKAHVESATEKTGAYSFKDELQVKLAGEKAAKTISTLRAQIDKLAATYKLGAKQPNGRPSAMPAEGAAALDDLLWKYLQLSCTPYRLVLFPQEYADNAEKPGYKATGTKRRTNSLEDMLKKGPFNEDLVASKQKMITPRFRIVSETCLKNVAYAKNIRPNAAAVPCLSQGAVAPACIQARKAAPHRGGGNGPRNSSNEGMEAF